MNINNKATLRIYYRRFSIGYYKLFWSCYYKNHLLIGIPAPNLLQVLKSTYGIFCMQLYILI